MIARCGEAGLGSVAARVEAQPLGDRFEPMSCQIAHEPVSVIVAVFLFLDRHHDNFLGACQKGHGVGDGPGRLRRRLPCDRHPVCHCHTGAAVLGINSGRPVSNSTASIVARAVASSPGAPRDATTRSAVIA